MRTFGLRLRAEPVLRIDGREIAAARFVDPRVLLAERDPPPSIRAHLDETRPRGNVRSIGA